jgi:hypothetical protein
MNKRAIRRRNRKIIDAANDLINPLECQVTGISGVDAVGVLGDDRTTGVALVVAIPPNVPWMDISTLIINRVRNVTRVQVDIPTTRI